MGPVREDGWGRSRKGAPVNGEERGGAGGDTKGKMEKERRGKGTEVNHHCHIQKVSSYTFSTVEFLEKKTEQVHGRGAFSSPNSCWRSTSLSVRG